MRNNKISVVRTNDKTIEKDDVVTVYYSDNYMIITKNYQSSDVGYKKLSNNQYLNTVTEEVKTIDKSVNNFRSVASLRKTFFKLSVLISLNFSGHQSEAFITLTYDSKKTKADCISRDLKNFWERLNRFNKARRLYRGLFLVEYQGNGRPHIHALLKRLDNEKITLSKSELSSLWLNGSVDIKTIYDVDGLIDYLNPFHNSKKMKRLGCYQPYEKIFRCRGHFNRLQKFKMTCESALKLAETTNLKEYKNTSYEVLCNGNKSINKITKIYYSKRRDSK